MLQSDQCTHVKYGLIELDQPFVGYEGIDLMLFRRPRCMATENIRQVDIKSTEKNLTHPPESARNPAFRVRLKITSAV